jgi:hypothetical protein
MARKIPEKSARVSSWRLKERSSPRNLSIAIGAIIKDASESRQAAITRDGTPSACANRMNIEEVETANIPKSIVKAGEIGGCLSESDKGLSRFWYMPENFTRQPVSGDRTKVTAIGAFRMGANYKNFPSLMVHLLNSFDHFTVNRMFEYHKITGFERTHHKGERGADQVISCFIFGFQAVSGDFNQFKHLYIIIEIKKICLPWISIAQY